MSATAINACGLILCGGQAHRMGGVDKPLLPLAGRPLIERVICRLQPQVETLLISANRHLQIYRHYTERVFDDGAFRNCGPLAGLAAGLAAAPGDWLASVPGDAPALPSDLVARLAAGVIGSGSRVAYAEDGSGPQRLCCLIHTSLASDLCDYLRAGGTAPGQWFARHAPTAVDFSDCPPWAWSVNTPEQWRFAEQRLREGAPA